MTGAKSKVISPCMVELQPRLVGPSLESSGESGHRTTGAGGLSYSGTPLVSRQESERVGTPATLSPPYLELSTKPRVGPEPSRAAGGGGFLHLARCHLCLPLSLAGHLSPSRWAITEDSCLSGHLSSDTSGVILGNIVTASSAPQSLHNGYRPPCCALNTPGPCLPQGLASVLAMCSLGWKGSELCRTLPHLLQDRPRCPTFRDAYLFNTLNAWTMARFCLPSMFPPVNVRDIWAGTLACLVH